MDGGVTMGAVKINGTTSGSVSLEAPATGSDVTLTLPGTTMNLGTELASKLPIAGGKILQIVRATDTSDRTTTSTSFVDVTGASVTITPQKSDSAILIICSFGSHMNNAASGYIAGSFRLTDNSNNALSGASDMFVGTRNLSTSGSPQVFDVVTLIGYSTPATTSATTYKLRARALVAGTDVVIVGSQGATQLYAIEVSA